MEYLKEEPTNEAKILFTGLDYSGKTSIITALQREFSKIALLKPTKGAQRKVFEYLDKSFWCWDLGGQRSYRIAYLKNPNKYFDKTDVAIYVIDIQDKDRLPEALSYFSDVIVQFKKLMVNPPPICIFFHKFDPALVKAAPNELKELITNLKEQIKKIALSAKVYFYQTSIFDFSSIITAMSEIFLSLYSKSEFLEKAIVEFSKKINSDGLVAIDDNSLVIGSYYKDEEVKVMLTASTPYFLTLNDSLKRAKSAVDDPDNQMTAQRFGRYFIFKQISLKEGVPPYYLLLVKNVPYIEKEDFFTFANLLKEILYK